MKTNIPWEDSSQDQEECRLPQSTNIRCLPCGIIACAPKIPPVRVFVFSVLQFSLLAICWHFFKFDFFARWWLRLGFEVWESKNEVFLKVKEIVLILFSSSATLRAPLWTTKPHKENGKVPHPLTSLSCLCKSEKMFPRICFPIIRWTETELFISCSKPSGRDHMMRAVPLSNKKGNKTSSETGIADYWLSIRTLPTSTLCQGNPFLGLLYHHWQSNWVGPFIPIQS